MKQLLLLTLFIPALLWAQDDSKYLAGAVPVENGKVVFAKEINAPSFSKDSGEAAPNFMTIYTKYFGN